MSTVTTTSIVSPTEFRTAEDTYLKTTGSGDWIKLTGDVIVLIESNAYLVASIERSSRDPASPSGPSVVPVEVIREEGAKGIPPIMLVEPYVGWWRVTLSQLSPVPVGAFATIIITGGAA